MGIEQNFDRNLQKSVKKQIPNLPTDSKFLFQQLLKNSHYIEENLEDGTEYNVGNLKEVINNLREQASYQEFNDIGIYGDVGPAYTFKSQGPIPGGYTERGYNFESDGPLGVDYFNEETELEEKVTGGEDDDSEGKTVGGSGCSGICIKNPTSGSEKYLELLWSPIHSIEDDDTLEKILVCIRDITKLKALTAESEEQKKKIEMIGQLIKVLPDDFGEFVSSANKYIKENTALIKEKGELPSLGDMERLFRNMHTIKGNARTHDFVFVSNAAHEAEQEYDQLRKGMKNNVF